MRLDDIKTCKASFMRLYVFLFLKLSWIARCLKITEKVSFNIASEASYVYILSGQDRLVLLGQKLSENAKVKKDSNATFWVIFK